MQDTQSTEIPSEWHKPENISDVTEMLSLCDNPESLKLSNPLFTRYVCGNIFMHLWYFLETGIAKPVFPR
ncbi:MAG: hypothetical protein AAF383_23385 [Cyanobacteria bacterium P01_A01_bin.83]